MNSKILAVLLVTLFAVVTGNFHFVPCSFAHIKLTINYLLNRLGSSRGLLSKMPKVLHGKV